MKNLNQLIKLPVLDYACLEMNKIEFEEAQILKVKEEIEEFTTEKDKINKCCELFDIIQSSLGLLELFSVDEIDQAFRLNMEKHKERKRFAVIGKYEIFKIIYKK